MSKHLQPCIYEGRAKELQLINCLIGTHDLACGCTEPLIHIENLIQSTKTPTCHGTTTTGDAADGLDIGDLDALFAENGDDDG